MQGVGRVGRDLWGTARARHHTEAARMTLAMDRDTTALVGDLVERIDQRRAVVAVVGLGYVGLPLLVAAGAEGFDVLGVDADRTKIDALKKGRSPVVDVHDKDLEYVERGQFSADHRTLVAADVIVVAVPTPLRDGAPDLTLVERAMTQVAEVVRPGQ